MLSPCFCATCCCAQQEWQSPIHSKLHTGGDLWTGAFKLIGPNPGMLNICSLQFHALLGHPHTVVEGCFSSAFCDWQGKEAVKAEAYREALKQTPNGFYRRQLYVLEVNLRQQQAMWVDLHHSIFYGVRCTVSLVSKWLLSCKAYAVPAS